MVQQADWFGAQAFGDGLQMWLKYSPAFNVHRIRTPVQYQGTSSSESFSSLLWSWEMFSRLRYLNKPVEYYVVPDIRHGSHTLQNPRQLVAVQNRALDWWCFWLKGEEDPDESKATQYVEWRKLRELHQADLKEPRSPRLKWTATAAADP